MDKPISLRPRGVSPKPSSPDADGAASKESSGLSPMSVFSGSAGVAVASNPPFGEDAPTTTGSRPPHPLFQEQGQTPPEAYGQVSYTTRPPWLVQAGGSEVLGSSISSYVVDGASVSPFPAEPGVSEGGTGTGSTPPMGGAMPAAGSTAPFGAPVGVGSVPPIPGVTPPPPPPPVRHRTRGGAGVLIRLFVLGVKLVPALGVLVGMYYGYSYYFGGVPAVDNLVQTVAGKVGVEAPLASKAGPSKAAAMFQMTQGVVAANDGRVNLANALADADADLESVEAQAAAKTETPSSMPLLFSGVAGGGQAAPGASGVRAAATPTEAAPVTYQTYVPNDVDEPAPVEVATAVEPSPEFRAWVEQARIGGVRTGSTPRLLIGGVTVTPGEMVNHALKISFDGVQPGAAVVLFRDESGAVIGKRY